MKEKPEVALNTLHPDCHKAADAFWQYWRKNGVPHKHGYYESTWGAINQALRLVGVVPHSYGVPKIEVKGTSYLEDCINTTPVAVDDVERLMEFYQVETLPALVQAQADHVERLQKKIKRQEPANIHPPRFA